MSKVKSNSEVYAEIVSEIASRAVAFVDGVELLGKSAEKRRLINDNDVHAYISQDNKAKIDIYLNIFYGFNIPDTICHVQEAIKTAVEKETCYVASEINVSVVSVVCKEEYQPEIVHKFADLDAEDYIPEDEPTFVPENEKTSPEKKDGADNDANK